MTARRSDEQRSGAVDGTHIHRHAPARTTREQETRRSGLPRRAALLALSTFSSFDSSSSVERSSRAMIAHAHTGRMRCRRCSSSHLDRLRRPATASPFRRLESRLPRQAAESLHRIEKVGTGARDRVVLMLAFTANAIAMNRLTWRRPTPTRRCQNIIASLRAIAFKTKAKAETQGTQQSPESQPR